MENQLSKLSTSAFLIIIASVTETPYFIKYPLLLVAVISIAIEIYKVYLRRKSTVSSTDQKGKR